MILMLVNRTRQKFFSNSWNYQLGPDVIDDSCNASLLEHSSRVVKIQLHDSLLHGAGYGAVFFARNRANWWQWPENAGDGPNVSVQ